MIYLFPWEEIIERDVGLPLGGERRRVPAGVVWGPGMGVIDPQGDLSGWGICSSPHPQPDSRWMLVGDDPREQLRSVDQIVRRDAIANRFGVTFVAQDMNAMIAELLDGHRLNGKGLVASDARAQKEVVLANEIIWSQRVPPRPHSQQFAETFPTTGDPATLSQVMTWIRSLAGGTFKVDASTPHRMSDSHASENLWLMTSTVVDTDNNQLTCTGAVSVGADFAISIGARVADAGTTWNGYILFWRRGGGGGPAQRAMWGEVGVSTTTLDDLITDTGGPASVGVKCDGSTITFTRPSDTYQTTDTNITVGKSCGVVHGPNNQGYVSGDLIFKDIAFEYRPIDVTRFPLHKLAKRARGEF